MRETIPAMMMGPLDLGHCQLRTAVLENKTRVISAGSINTMLGCARSGLSNTQRLRGIMPQFMRDLVIKPFISEDLHRALADPIIYSYKNQQVEYGFAAVDVVKACEVWMDARKAGVLDQNERALHKADVAEMFVRAIAKVGIIAMIDEATGYQAKREADALQKFLSLFLSEEKLKWAKRFPNDFYKQIFRLKGWDYNDASSKRPKIIGQITNELVYSKLAPSVLDELKRRNPVDETTHKRSYYHHQLLADIGVDALRVHLIQVIFLMKMHTNWDDFIKDFHIRFPDPEMLELPAEKIA